MKDIETTWSHIVGRKLWKIRADRNMTQADLADRVWVSQVAISRLLNRKDKGNDDIFTKMGVALWLPVKEIKEILNGSLYEAIEMDYPEAWLGFALKNRFWVSEQWLRDILMFIWEVQKKEAKRK